MYGQGLPSFQFPVLIVPKHLRNLLGDELFFKNPFPTDELFQASRSTIDISMENCLSHL